MRKTVLALALGLLLGSAGTAVAADTDAVQAVYAKFNIVINGEAKQLSTDPLVVDGTSYLPVRELADLLGYTLTYDDATRTIELIQPKEKENQHAEVNSMVQEKLKGRELIELLGQKYPEMVNDTPSEISLSPDGTLRFGDQIFHLEKDQNGYYNTEQLIRAGIID